MYKAFWQLLNKAARNTVHSSSFWRYVNIVTWYRHYTAAVTSVSRMLGLLATLARDRGQASVAPVLCQCLFSHYLYDVIYRCTLGLPKCAKNTGINVKFKDFLGIVALTSTLASFSRHLSEIFSHPTVSTYSFVLACFFPWRLPRPGPSQKFLEIQQCHLQGGNYIDGRYDYNSNSNNVESQVSNYMTEWLLTGMACLMQ